MSNESDNRRRYLTLRKWLLWIGGGFITLLIVYGLYIRTYGPPIGTIFTRVPLNESEDDGLNQNDASSAEGPSSLETAEPAKPGDIDMTVASNAETDISSGTPNDFPNTLPDTGGGGVINADPESFIDTPEPGEPAPPPTPAQVSEVTCTGPPAGWIEYTIQAGDTLTALALTSGSSVNELQRANCLTNETLIAGALFYLPQVPPSPTAVRAPATAAPTVTVTSETAVAELVPSAITFPPTPVPISSPPLPEESTSLLWFLWIVMLALLIGALVWIWRQRRRA